MLVLQNVEEKGRRISRGQHCSLQFSPEKFTDRPVPLSINDNGY